MDFNINIGLILGIVAAVVVLGIFIGRYVTVPAGKALVVTGSFLGPNGKDGIKIIKGGGTFLWPIFQEAKLLDLRNMTLEVEAVDAYTLHNVPITVAGTVVIKIGSTLETIATAAEQYLGKEPEQMHHDIRAVLEGHLRSILGGLKVEVINQDRVTFGDQVKKIAQTELSNMGLEIMSFSIKEITDRNKYLESLGRPEIAEAQKIADIAQAEATKETTVRKAQADKESKEAENTRDVLIAESNKNKEIKMAAFKQEQETQRAVAEKAFEIKDAELKETLAEKEANVVLMERKKAIEVEEEEIALQEKRLSATVRKPADAKRYAEEQEALAEKAKRIANAEAQAQETTLKATAEAKQTTLRAEAESTEVTLKATAEATKIAQIGEATATSEAKLISEVGLAKATSAEKLAEAYNQFGVQAINLMTTLELLKVYPELMESVAKQVGNIDKITIIDGGGDGSGVNKVAGFAPQALASLQESLEATMGLDVKGLINSYVGNHNVGAQIKDLNETIKQADDKEIA